MSETVRVVANECQTLSPYINFSQHRPVLAALTPSVFRHNGTLPTSRMKVHTILVGMEIMGEDETILFNKRFKQNFETSFDLKYPYRDGLRHQ